MKRDPQKPGSYVLRRCGFPDRIATLVFVPEHEELGEHVDGAVIPFSLMELDDWFGPFDFDKPWWHDGT